MASSHCIPKESENWSGIIESLDATSITVCTILTR
jgi:hypothetical protein